MGNAGSKKKGSRSSGKAREPDSGLRGFLTKPGVTVALGAGIGLLLLGGSIWFFSASGGDSGDSNKADVASSEDTSQDATPTPRVEVDTESIDLGRITQDDTATRTITVTNSGDELLIIRDVDAS